MISCRGTRHRFRGTFCRHKNFPGCEQQRLSLAPLGSKPCTMSARRYRSAVACESCRRRKVRCSLTVTGVPCIGCAQDKTDCVVDPKRSQTMSRATRRRLQSPDHDHSGDTNASRQLSSPAQPQPQHADDRANAPVNHQSPASCGLQNEERSGIEIASAALGRPERVGQVPYYTGSQVPLLPSAGNG